MKIISIYILIAGCLYLITRPYKDNIDLMLASVKLSTFDALWLSYVGGIIMLIIS
jgi:hypothetical protein